MVGQGLFGSEKKIADFRYSNTLLYTFPLTLDILTLEILILC